MNFGFANDLKAGKVGVEVMDMGPEGMLLMEDDIVAGLSLIHI